MDIFIFSIVYCNYINCSPFSDRGGSSGFQASKVYNQPGQLYGQTPAPSQNYAQSTASSQSYGQVRIIFYRIHYPTFCCHFFWPILQIYFIVSRDPLHCTYAGITYLPLRCIVKIIANSLDLSITR